MKPLISRATSSGLSFLSLCFPLPPQHFNLGVMVGNQAVTSQVKWWDRMLDTVMGGEDYMIACGNDKCKTLFRTLTKEEAENTGNAFHRSVIDCFVHVGS